MEEFTFVIPFEPRTKKNSMRVGVNKATGKTVVLPSEQFSEYQKMVQYFIPNRYMKYNEPLEITAQFYMKTHRRVDLVNLLEALDDILVHFGVIEDDNSQIIVSHDGSRVFYDKDRPRTVVRIRGLSE